MDFANDLDLINNISVSIEQKANSTNFCPSTSAVSTGATRYLWIGSYSFGSRKDWQASITGIRREAWTAASI